MQKKLGGTGGTYTGTWTVIGVEEDKLKLVSTETVGIVVLGYEDPGAIASITVANEDSITAEEKLERSIWSYKNAITTLNTKAQETTGIVSAKSIALEDIYEIIGEENVDKGRDYGIEYTYDNSKTWNKIFVDDNGKTIKMDTVEEEVKLKNTAFNYELTLEQKNAIGSLSNKRYFLASICHSCNMDNADWGVHEMFNGTISYLKMFSSFGSGLGAAIDALAVVYM